jgi:phosphate transport system substrate-binding protein
MKNNRKLFSIAVMAVLILSLLAACSPAATPTAAPAATEAPAKATEAPAEPTKEPAPATEELSGKITLAGSTTVQPLAEKFAEGFMAAHANVTIDVQGGGSSVGVKAATEKTADLGMASRELKDSELAAGDIRVYVIARDGIAVVVNPDVTVDDLTPQQVQDIFSGKVTNWKDLGGEDKNIVVVSREEGSGTRSAFEELVMSKEVLITDTAILQPSNGAVRTTVSTTPDSIGYISMGYIDNTVKAVKINGVEATEANAKNGSFPIVRPLNLVGNGDPSPLVQAFLDYAMGPEGQAIVAEEGYITITEEPAAEVTGKITMAGSTTVQPLAEKFAESFMAKHSGVTVDVQGGGSSVGVKAAAEKTADIGMASRELKESELSANPELKVFVIARDGIAVVVNAEVTVDDLTMDQVRDIFNGKITNWKEVGGADQSIIVVSREEGSGTRAAFEEMVMGKDVLITDTAILQPSNGAMRTTVSTTPHSIGYLSMGYIDDTVVAIKVNGVEPSEENAANGSFPIVRPLNLITSGEPAGAVKAFLDFILSPDGQAIVVEEGYIAVK